METGSDVGFVPHCQKGASLQLRSSEFCEQHHGRGSVDMLHLLCPWASGVPFPVTHSTFLPSLTLKAVCSSRAHMAADESVQGPLTFPFEPLLVLYAFHHIIAVATSSTRMLCKDVSTHTSLAQNEPNIEQRAMRTRVRGHVCQGTESHRFALQPAGLRSHNGLESHAETPPSQQLRQRTSWQKG